MDIVAVRMDLVVKKKKLLVSFTATYHDGHEEEAVSPLTGPEVEVCFEDWGGKLQVRFSVPKRNKEFRLATFTTTDPGGNVKTASKLMRTNAALVRFTNKGLKVRLI